MQTVADAIKILIPFGPNGELLDEYIVQHPIEDEDFIVAEDFFTWSRQQSINKWQALPEWPLDAFAVAGFLAKRTGAHTFVMPGLPYHSGPPDVPDTAKNSDPFELFGKNGKIRKSHMRWGQFWRYGLTLTATKDGISTANLKKQIKKDDHLPRVVYEEFKVGVSQKEIKTVRQEIDKCWEGIVNAAEMSLVRPLGPWEMLYQDDERREFFKWLLKFLVIADEACAGIAQKAAHPKGGEAGQRPWLIKTLDARWYEQLEEQEKARGNPAGKDSMPVLEAEVFNEWSDADLAPVLPKSRTISLGCSLRNLSRNVALAPITTEVQGHWMRQEGAGDTDVLNLLLIPYPYELPFNAFQPSHKEAELPKDVRARNWRWFKLDQSTYLPQTGDLREALIDRFVEMVRTASADCGTSNEKGVNGVILPENALDYDLFERLALRLCETPSVEFLICGTSGVPLGPLMQGRGVEFNSSRLKHGNFVCTATYTGEPLERRCELNFQHKHHRWKLTDKQIIDYGAAASLDITKDHWENIKISNRSLNFWNFRKDSSFVSLICEDLARNDPAQQLIRTVGPGLVFAILMDGPQIPKRWPGQFAASLSTDPGASVLTLTNHGILKNRDSGGKYPLSHAIAIWADADKSPRSITMDPKASGVLLNVSPVAVNAHSLDGRSRVNGALKWLLSGVKNVFEDSNGKTMAGSSSIGVKL